MEKFSIPIVGGAKLVNPALIVYLKADNKMAWVCVFKNEKDGKTTEEMIHGDALLWEFENRFREKDYKDIIRVHDSWIVNLQLAKEFKRQDNSGKLAMETGTVIPVSPTYYRKVYNFFESNTISWLVVNEQGEKTKKYALRKGRQSVGRKAITSDSDIQVDTENRYMGRNHFLIEARKNTKKTYDFFVSINELVNPTLCDNILMETGKLYTLKEDTIIKIDTLTFKLDTEDTILVRS